MRKKSIEPRRLPPLDDNLFQFPKATKKELLRLLGGNSPAKAETFVNALQFLVHQSRIGNRRPPLPTSASVRREISALADSLRDFLHRISDEGISPEAWERLEPHISFALASRLRELTDVERMAYLTRHDGLRIIFQMTVAEICDAIEIASCASEMEAKGGRPPAANKERMVQQAVRLFQQTFGRPPPKTKESGFEEVMRISLESAEFIPGNVYALILASVKAIEQSKVQEPRPN